MHSTCPVRAFSGRIGSRLRHRTVGEQPRHESECRNGPTGRSCVCNGRLRLRLSRACEASAKGFEGLACLGVQPERVQKIAVLESAELLLVLFTVSARRSRASVHLSAILSCSPKSRSTSCICSPNRRDKGC